MKRFFVSGTFESVFEEVVEAHDKEDVVRVLMKRGPDPTHTRILQPITIEVIEETDAKP